MPKFRMRMYLVAGASLYALAGGVSAHAQDAGSDEASSGGLSEIVVTAQKREQRLQDVPVAVSALSGETLSKVGADQTEALTSLVPGLNLNNSVAGFRPFLRGVGTATAAPGNENSVSIYVDNVYMTVMSAGALNLTSVQSLEVLKGPQGTLFGRNASAGVIHVRTKDPSHDFGGDVSLGMDNYKTLTGTAYVTGGLSENVAADLAVYYRKQYEGYGKNLVTGNDISDDRDVTVRSKLLFTPGDADRIMLSADYSNTHNSGQVLKLWPGFSAAWGGPVTAEYPTQLGSPYEEPAGIDPWDVVMATDPFNRVWFAGGSLTWEHEFDWATLSSFTAYREHGNQMAWNYGPAPRAVQQSGWDQSSWQFTQELQLASAKSSNVQWIVGFYYLDTAISNNQIFAGLQRGVNATGTADTGCLPASCVQLQFRSRQSTKSPAFYGQVTVPITNSTNLTGGLRYTIDKRAMLGGIDVAAMPDPLNPQPSNVTPLPATVDASRTYKTFTWRAGIDHHFTPGIMVYATYNRGFKAGVFNSVPPNATPTNPEYIDAFEVGMKNTLLGGRATLNIAAFLYKYRDLQVTLFTTAGAVTVNAAKAEIKGVDIDFNAQVTDNLRVTLAGSFLDAKYTEYLNGPILARNPVASGGGLTRTFGDVSGNHLGYTSDVVLNGGLFYETPVSIGTVDANVNVTYNSGFYFEPSELVKQKAFVELTATLGLTLDGGTRFSVFGRNLANEVIARSVVSGANPGGYLNAQYRPPRTYGIAISQKF